MGQGINNKFTSKFFIVIKLKSTVHYYIRVLSHYEIVINLNHLTKNKSILV